MQIYQCPNCGRTYTEFQNVYYCGNCNYRLKKQEDITKVKHPELSERKYKVVGTTSEQTKVECPYCHSTNTSKISGFSKAMSRAAHHINIQWHCNKCGSDF